MKSIFAVSGRKGSGKDTLCRQIASLFSRPAIVPFAAPLKRFCVDILGLSPELVWGTEEQKQKFSLIRWESVPYSEGRRGFMTGREVMQHWGTEVFRSVNPDIWIDAWKRSIDEDSVSDVFLVPDLRFPNELHLVKDMGGYSVRLCRVPPGYNDTHSSETALNDLTKGFNSVIPDGLDERETFFFLYMAFSEK